MLAQWNNSSRIDISRYRAIQLFLLLPNTVVIGEEANACFIILDLCRAGLKPRSTTLAECTLTIKPHIRFGQLENKEIPVMGSDAPKNLNSLPLVNQGHRFSNLKTRQYKVWRNYSTLVCCGVHVWQSYAFYVVFCRPLGILLPFD